MTSHIDDVDTDNVAHIPVVALSEMEETTGDRDCCSTAVLPFIDSKRANSNIVSASIEAVNGMSVDGCCIVCKAPSSSPNDVGQDPEKTTIRRSRRARIATDRYTPNDTQVSDPISEASSSNPMLKRDRTRSNKQKAEAKPSKSIQECDNFTAPSRVFPKGTVENNDRKSEYVRTELSCTEKNIKNDTTTVDGKPTRERKPTDFFHNHIPPKLQPESSSYSEYTSTKGFRPPKTANSGAFPPLPPNGQITNAIVEDLSTLELNGWTADEIQQLHDAHRQVDPTSSSFWLDVANKIHTRTATECQSQWFSLAKTPAPKSRKIQPKLEYHQEDDDDIFQSTPMRECVFPVSSMSNLPSLNGLRALPPIPLNAKTTTTYNDSGIQEEPGQDRTKPFSKSFLQRMRKDHVKAEKGTNLTQKATKGLHGTKNSHVLSEMIRNNEMDINIRLTPGGTLKVKSHVEDDDFWDEQYEDEDD
jgi:Myb-like DNA-binding domain